MKSDAAPLAARPGSETAEEMLHRMKSANGLTEEESKTFVTLLHKLDRIRLAMVSGYALGLASMPRHTVIPEGHWMLNKSPNAELCDGSRS